MKWQTAKQRGCEANKIEGKKTFNIGIGEKYRKSTCLRFYQYITNIDQNADVSSEGRAGSLPTAGTSSYGHQ